MRGRGLLTGRPSTREAAETSEPKPTHRHNEGGARHDSDDDVTPKQTVKLTFVMPD